MKKLTKQKTIENLQQQLELMQKQIQELQAQLEVNHKEKSPESEKLELEKKEMPDQKMEPSVSTKSVPDVTIGKFKEKISRLKELVKEKKLRLKTAKISKTEKKPAAKKVAPEIIKSKPTIAIVSLTCCEGCQVTVLDLGQKFLDLSENITIGDFSFLEDKPEKPSYDVVFVEGAPITKENILRLKDLRKRSRFLVALGACAALGGIAEIKNYQDKFERLRYVYKNFEGINNPDIKPLSFFVKVDFEIPGCPINNEEFLAVANQLIAGIPPKIKQRPVCYECQIKQNKCLLQEGLPCLGPVILGGCGAPCPSSAYPCDGCRGPIKNINPDKLNKQLMTQGYTQTEIDLITQRFGMEDRIYPELPMLKDQKKIN